MYCLVLNVTKCDHSYVICLKSINPAPIHTIFFYICGKKKIRYLLMSSNCWSKH